MSLNLFRCTRCGRQVMSPSLSLRDLVMAHWRECPRFKGERDEEEEVARRG